MHGYEWTPLSKSQQQSLLLREPEVVSLGPYSSYGKLHLPRVTTELN